MGNNREIRVLLADDQRLMREGLRILLELEEDIEVVGEADDGAQAVELYRSIEPDVVLMDVQMPGMDGVAATREICALDPGARVMILTTFDDDEFVFEGIRAGALGYMLKAASGEELAAAVRTLADGGALIEPSVARKVMTEFARLRPSQGAGSSSLVEPLTEREIEIVLQLERGLSNREIASHLFLAEGTVKNYVSNIISKLSARDRGHAVIRARDLGII